MLTILQLCCVHAQLCVPPESAGVAVDMSVDHKPTDPPELERILHAGGQVGADSRVNGGLNLSRAIGEGIIWT